MPLYQKIYAMVKRIPTGTVTSYGRIAREVGCSAREVGYAMAAVPSGEGIPWHRVINAKGEVSPRKGGDGEHEQRERLRAEGVMFDANGRVDFTRYGWGERELPGQGKLW